MGWGITPFIYSRYENNNNMKEIIERIIKEANVARLDSDRIEIQWNDLDNMSDDIMREITNYITNKLNN